MTDFADACFGCGGHLRRNVYSGTLCPECEVKREAGEITMYGNPLRNGELGLTETVERELKFTMELQRRRA